MISRSLPRQSEAAQWHRCCRSLELRSAADRAPCSQIEVSAQAAAGRAVQSGERLSALSRLSKADYRAAKFEREATKATACQPRKQ